MPIYEYQCPKCGRVFEEWAKSSEAHKDKQCPDCGAMSPRIISRTSFVLKGDGWYVSDYGYRKGISEDSGDKAAAPASAKPASPAVQGDKSLTQKESSPPAVQGGKSLASKEKGAAPAKTENSASEAKKD